METRDDGRAAMRAIGVAAIALIGLAFSLLPVAERLDAALLDLEWRLLRRFDSRPAPEEIVIVGVDEASVRAIPEPPGMWHAPLGRALTRLAAARPRAIGLALPLPERSYDSVKAGVDRALFEGLANAVETTPFVASLSIDARTRGARNIHLPFLALLGEARLGIDLTARDVDGVARRFSLAVPTEDGGFPTIEGRLCTVMKRKCSDGLIHYSLGPAFTYVPLKNLLAMSDERQLEGLFRDRIVLVGEALAYTDRIDVPVNYAGWEGGERTSPSIVVHAQTLRTALAGAAPQDASRPAIVLLLTLAALVFLVREPRMAALAAALVAVGVIVAAVLMLRGGLFLPASAAIFTAALALGTRLVVSRRARKAP